MYCYHCGKRIDDEARFCRFCGMPTTAQSEQAVNADSPPPRDNPSGQEREHPVSTAPASPTNAKRAKGHPKMIGLILGIAICAALVTASLVGGIAHINLPGSASSSSESKVEGTGFDSPEEAIIGYLEALQTGNLDNVLSTFAVESYCENYDFEAQIEQNGFYMWSTMRDQPVAYGESEFLREITRNNRKENIVQQLYWQMLQLYGSFDDVIADYSTFTEESDIQRAIAALSNLSEELDLSALEIGDIIYGEVMHEDNFVHTLGRMKEYGDIIGAEGFKSLAVSFSLNGTYGILFMDTAKIDGKWYNVRPGGFISYLSGVDTWHCGMIYGDDDYLIEALGQLGQERTSAGEALSTFYAYQDSIIPMYKTAISESLSELSDYFGLEDLNMTIPEMLEYFSMTELQ